MSGSSGSSYRDVNTSSKINTSQEAVSTSELEMEINKLLEELLKHINDRDVEAIRTHLNEIEKILGKEIEGIEQILFGGSLSKKTFVEGISDVDALVVIKPDIASGLTPKELQNKFYDLLLQRFPNTEINKGVLAVTIKFYDYEIQLLPAIREEGKIRIASSKSLEWSQLINTTAFTSKLTGINKINSNKVVPVIKLTKHLLGLLPERYKLSGYHIEALAVEAFNGYNGRITLFDMTKHLLNTAEKRILKPMIDITGQSGNIDQYFGEKNSLYRQYASKQIRALNGKFSNPATINSIRTLFD